MSSHLKDPLASEYLAAKAKQKKDFEMLFNLASFLAKLEVWPTTEYQGRQAPLSGPSSVFKSWYQNKRRHYDR
jgi:hypothetical protein